MIEPCSLTGCGARRILGLSISRGNFLPWIEAEFSMAERTARRFMDAAEAFPGKSANVADLPATILYALAAPSTPEPIREAFMRKA